MNTIKVFEQLNIRFVDHPEGKYEFGIVSSDLACVLGLNHDGHKIARSVDDEWKGLHNMHTPGGTQSVTVVWEPGVYQLLAKSRKPQAKPFQKWLFEEVLPSIRKTGSYSVAEAPALPPRDTIDYIDAAEKLDLMQDGTLKMLLKDCLVDELELKRNQKALPGGAEKKKYTIVKVRAKQLGYTAKEVKDGTSLGRYIHARIKPAYQEMVGRYPVFHYEITPELDTAIHTFFGATQTQLLID